MKKLLLTLTLVAATALTMYGQGRVAFNNEISPLAGAITIGAQHVEGATGDPLGTAYSVQLLWAPAGTYANEAAFRNAVLGSSGLATFEGNTAATGAGFFNGGSVPNPVGTLMPAGNYTMMAQAWFNNGLYATYGAAVGHNRGVSAFFNIAATASPTAPNNTPVAGFTVGGTNVPEPSTFALAGLGAAALLLFRRRK
jgi:hypothetical protein